jgi:hypothetical protein
MIPTSFQILNHTIDVVIDNEYCYKNECFGIYLYNDDRIILADKYKTKRGWRKYKQETVEHVFYHELTHCILYYMNSDLWNNEEFVDHFGGLLAQIIQTKNECTEIKRKS